MDKRTIIAIVLSIAVIVVYQIFFLKPPVKQAQQSVQKTTTAEDKGTLTAPVPTASQAPASKPAPVVAPAPAAIPEKMVTVDTPLYTAVMTTKGAALKSFRLKGYRQTIDEKSDLIELVQLQQGMPSPLTVSFPGSSLNVQAESSFEVDTASLDLTNIREPRQITFSQTYPGRLRVDKIFTFHPGKYSIDLEVKAYNLTPEPIGQIAGINWYEHVDPKAETDSYTHEGPIVFAKKDIERQEVKKLEAEITLGPDVAWGGFEKKYFIAAMIPQNPSLSSIVMAKDNNNMVSVSLRGGKSVIPAGQAGSFNYTLFLGPKDYSILKAQGIGLEDAIDFGSWLKWLAMPMLIVLKFFNEFIHNYGLSIIVLTILIKVIFWPLGNKSYSSMKEMQKLQPKMAELREKYKTDKQRLSQETMALYKTHKVNPLGGCLPMVIQIPVFFGLYKTLLYAIELRHSPFFWWIQDLSAKDPYYITPIIMGGTMFVQQKMTP
ncbi:MAG: membrane protein insertase YidC, partial [Syntrophales bacterium]|nr:membrane protein insertase YidC [Syntrophales bacterium]